MTTTPIDERLAAVAFREGPLTWRELILIVKSDYAPGKPPPLELIDELIAERAVDPDGWLLCDLDDASPAAVMAAWTRLRKILRKALLALSLEEGDPLADLFAPGAAGPATTKEVD